MLRTLCWALAIGLVGGSAGASVVTIDAKNRTVVDGKPMFVNGVYFQWDVPAVDAERVKDAGFNVVQAYGTLALDRLAPYGLYGIFPINDDTLTAPDIGQAVSAQKDNPSLLGWYINDELNYLNRSAIACAHYDAVRSGDTSHPTISALVGWHMGEDESRFVGCTDVMGFDDYPIGTTYPLKTLYDWTIAYRNVVGGKKPVWAVAQMARLGGAGGDRDPTVQEIRLMAYLPLIAKADGLLWYSYYDVLRDFDTNNPLASDSPIVVARWDKVRAMSLDVASLYDVLLDGSDREVTSSDNAALVRGIEYGGALYVLIANPNPSASVTTTLTLAPGDWNVGAASVRSGSMTLVAQGASLSVTLPANESGTIVVRSASDAAVSKDAATFLPDATAPRDASATSPDATSSDAQPGRPAVDAAAAVEASPEVAAPPDAEAPGGCGCSTSPSGASFSLGLFGAALAAIAGRRRLKRRVLV